MTSRCGQRSAKMVEKPISNLWRSIVNLFDFASGNIGEKSTRNINPIFRLDYEQTFAIFAWWPTSGLSYWRSCRRFPELLSRCSPGI